MAKWVRIGLAAVIVVFAVVMTRGVLRESEPVYQGKQLSQWLQEAFDSREDTPFFEYQPESRPVAMKAVQAMGTNALPSLVRMLKKTEPLFLRQRWADGLMKLLRVRRTKADDGNAQAVFGFCALGTNAAAAVPELGELLLKRRDYYTAMALANVGPDGVLVLGQALTNQANAQTAAALKLQSSIIVAFGARAALARREPDASPEGVARSTRDLQIMTQALLQGLDNSGVDARGRPVRLKVARLLTALGTGQEQAVRVCVDCFTNSNASIRRESMSALSRAGPAATSAVPALVLALDDPDATVRLAAARTLFHIQPTGSATAIAVLVERLEHENAQFRGEAARWLGLMVAPGPSAEPVIGSLLAASADPDLGVREEITNSLQRINAEGVRKARER